MAYRKPSSRMKFFANFSPSSNKSDAKKSFQSAYQLSHFANYAASASNKNAAEDEACVCGLESLVRRSMEKNKFSSQRFFRRRVGGERKVKVNLPHKKRGYTRCSCGNNLFKDFCRRRDSAWSLLAHS